MSYTAKGTIHQISATNQISDKFKKREFIMMVEDGQYTQYLNFEMVQDNVNKLDQVQPGDTVEVSFNLRGRIYGNKCYNTLQAWKIQKDVPMPQQPQKVEKNNQPVNTGSIDDNLPF